MTAPQDKKLQEAILRALGYDVMENHLVTFGDCTPEEQVDNLYKLIAARDSEIERKATERYTDRLIRAVRDGEIETITISLDKLRDELYDELDAARSKSSAQDINPGH